MDYIYRELAEQIYNLDPRGSFNEAYKELQVPGAVLFKAERDGQLLGLSLFYLEGDIVRLHKIYQSKKGKEFFSQYLMTYEAMYYFKQLGCDLMTLNIHEAFAEGWTEYTRKNYIVKKVFNRWKT